MKRFISLVFFFSFALLLNSQVRHDVIASAGDYSVSGGVSISWTLGETVIPAYQNGDVILTHGFQQQLIVATLEKNPELEVEIIIYPNPASDVLNLKFGSPASEEMTVLLLDSQGRVIRTEKVESASADKQINMQEMASGMYYIKLIKGKFTNVYKVVKL